MNYAALTPTVDLLEVLLALCLLFAWWYAVKNVHNGWQEKEWSIDDPDPVMRRLGAMRYDNARILAGILFLITVGDLLMMLVPSAIQTQESITEVLAAFGLRVILIGTVLGLTYKIWNDSWWRRFSDEHGPRPHPAKDGKPVAAVPGVPVVEAPAVVVEPDGVDA